MSEPDVIGYFAERPAACDWLCDGEWKDSRHGQHGCEGWAVDTERSGGALTFQNKLSFFSSSSPSSLHLVVTSLLRCRRPGGKIHLKHSSRCTKDTPQPGLPLVVRGELDFPPRLRPVLQLDLLGG
ncbi:hypothetical protein HYQ46_009800 [Verticillium longisporum]|nr:hypothetical protein HYQ46_009800 [Verticillium longisporum]